MIATALCIASIGATWRTENVIITQAPGEETARIMAEACESKRRQICEDWGTDPGRGCIVVLKLDGKDSASFWGADDENTWDYIWVHGTKDAQRTQGLIAHELCHHVMSKHKLPPWASEAIASEHDDESRKKQRRAIMTNYIGVDLSIRVMMRRKVFDADDQSAYAIAESFYTYLQTLGTKKKFLKFAKTEDAEGNYGRTLDTLIAGWNAWRQEYYRVSPSPPGRDDDDARMKSRPDRGG